jgi:hypothetical protein
MVVPSSGAEVAAGAVAAVSFVAAVSAAAESVDPLQAANNATAVMLKIRLIFFIASLQCAKNKCCLPNAQII